MSKENTLALMKKDVVDVVTERVRKFMEHGELDLPPNYSPENALKSAWLILQSTQDKDNASPGGLYKGQLQMPC